MLVTEQARYPNHLIPPIIPVGHMLLGARNTYNLFNSVDPLSLGRYFSVIGATIWTYDYALTITDEVTLVWSRKFSLVKCLYFTVCPPSLFPSRNVDP